MNNVTTGVTSSPHPMTLLSNAIKNERERQRLSMTELAKRAGIAKSSLSQLEAGSGNPSLETLWALALALNVPVSQLIAPPQPQVELIRADEGVSTASEQAIYRATLLSSGPSGGQRDVYRLNVQPGEPRRSEPHWPGTVEHVFLCRGRALVGPSDQAEVLVAGDYIRYAADVAHVFEAYETDTLALMVIEHA
ncbi:helix-turn-helix domain-containing protein [Neisseriaceae bacterium CLB008]|nr:helix-turn-helix transcriptional regulator [Neisseriaceae bacterium]